MIAMIGKSSVSRYSGDIHSVNAYFLDVNHPVSGIRPAYQPAAEIVERTRDRAVPEAFRKCKAASHDREHGAPILE